MATIPNAPALIESALDIYKALESNLLAGCVIRNSEVSVEDYGNVRMLTLQYYNGTPINGYFNCEMDLDTYEEICWLWENGGKFSKLLVQDDAVVRYRKLRALAAFYAA